jgi:hypothetical protein
VHSTIYLQPEALITNVCTYSCRNTLCLFSNNSPTTGARTGKWHIEGKRTTTAGTTSAAFNTLAKRHNATSTTDSKCTYNSGISSNSSSNSKPVRGIGYTTERTVFVHNIAFIATVSELMAHMERDIGKINHVQLQCDDQGCLTGAAYVDYAIADHVSTLNYNYLWQNLNNLLYVVSMYNMQVPASQ